MFARTDRLLLRPGWAEDAPALTAAIGDPLIVRNLARAPWPYRQADADAFLARAAEMPALMIVERDGTLVGGIGIDRGCADAPELGYWIVRSRWGRGYATEAGSAMLAIARDALRLPTLVAGHFDDNPASARVLAKLGFSDSGERRPRFSVGRGTSVMTQLHRWTSGAAPRPAPAAAPLFGPWLDQCAGAARVDISAS